MASEHSNAGRKLRVNAEIGAGAAPQAPQLRSVRPRKLADYPDVPQAYLRIARHFSNPLLVGPPICDELIALVRHMFTHEEALLAQHIRFPTGKTARSVAAMARRPVDQVRSTLDHLAGNKHLLLGFGTGRKKRYGLPPLIPGVFEMALVRSSWDTLTDWHRRFAELFSALYDTGYLAHYCERPTGPIRYLPVNKTIEAHPLALPSDQLETILDRYTAFAVGLCQCRMTQKIVDRGCDRPMETCVGYGDAAEHLIRQDRMRRVTKRDVLKIKAEAESAGLATFVVDMGTRKSASGFSCSCCGCCCHALRSVSEFDMPGMIARPHFLPEWRVDACTYCAECAKVCPTGALVVNTKEKSHRHLVERCIGCGLCAVACRKQRAIRMEPVAKYRDPPDGLFSGLLRLAPNHLRNAWSVWRKRREA
jgi:Pyruvate/2-oxoacid:ferredoxin oxidoreductase delta subunit